MVFLVETLTVPSPRMRGTGLRRSSSSPETSGRPSPAGRGVWHGCLALLGALVPAMCTSDRHLDSVGLSTMDAAPMDARRLPGAAVGLAAWLLTAVLQVVPQAALQAVLQAAVLLRSRSLSSLASMAETRARSSRSQICWSVLFGDTINFSFEDVWVLVQLSAHQTPETRWDSVSSSVDAVVPTSLPAIMLAADARAGCPQLGAARGTGSRGAGNPQPGA